MNSDELKYLKKIEKTRRIDSLYDEFLGNYQVSFLKESEAIEFAKYLIKHSAIFKFYKRIQLHPGNFGMLEPYKEEVVWVFENHGVND
jgi:DNA-directed RNA polymerase subunit L